MTVGRARLAECLAMGDGRARLLAPVASYSYSNEIGRCAERAKLAPDPEIKRTYEDMAHQWLDLAKQAEKDGGDP